MPRYFFHVRDADGLSLDSEDAVLSGDEGACVEAVQAAREMLAEKILKNEVWTAQSLKSSGAMASWWLKFR